jgi:hypothetical protein
VCIRRSRAEAGLYSAIRVQAGRLRSANAAVTVNKKKNHCTIDNGGDQGDGNHYREYIMQFGQIF